MAQTKHAPVFPILPEVSGLLLREGHYSIMVMKQEFKKQGDGEWV